MKGKDIRIQAQLDFSRSIDPLYAINYLNEGQRKLALNFKYARVEEKVTITVTDTLEYYDLLTTVLSVKSITENGYKYLGAYDIDGKTILIPYKGTYVVTILRYPKSLADENIEPEIPEEYHDSLSKWIAYKERSRIYTENDKTAQTFLTDFWSNSRDVNIALKRREKKIRRIRVGRF